MSETRPIGVRAALGLVVGGAAAFLVLLYALGQGWVGGGNDGGGHVLSKGLTGYAALAALVERTDGAVVRSRDPRDLERPGLLVLTPPHNVDGEELAAIVERRRMIGPTVVVLPKWFALPAQGGEARQGWVTLSGTLPGTVVASLDDRLGVAIGRADLAHFDPVAGSAKLADRSEVQALTIADDAALRLVRDSTSRTLVAYLNDDGDYPRLDRWAGFEPVDEPDATLHPLVIVAEPDLLDNRGLADESTAHNALALIRAARGDSDGPVVFDVTLNGLGRARNLLTLAFTPPFLAATLALLLAALAAGWRSFARFGPARLAVRPLAYGKTALVENSAGLIRRAGRISLLGAPYAALVTHRLSRALGLPPSADAAAIDAAQARRGHDGPTFSETAAALSGARKSHDLVRRAAALNAIERALSR